MTTKARTDSEIRQRVQDELDWDPMVNAVGIGVQVVEGVVTLDGKVDHYAQKFAAGQAAHRVAGVRAVADDIRVTGRLASDTEIARNIVHAFANCTDVPADRINVLVEDGQVTLRGSLDWGEQRSVAENLARHVRGVVSIIDRISIAQQNVTAAEISSGIDLAFARHARLDASKVTVAIDGGHLTLSGSVSSLAEREEAEFVAWRARGVTEVTNLIKIESEPWG